MRFCTATFGCKVNQVETLAIENILTSRGHVLAEPGEGCDACIINTCTVTAESARKSRQAVRRMKKLEPGAVIAVCGCLSQLEPGKAGELGADLVGGSGDRRGFALEIEKMLGRSERKVVVDDAAGRRLFEELPTGGSGARTRAMLKIQDGCDNFCAYCVIPFARGRSRSLPPQQAATHARQLGRQGFREIVVTGIEISSYGIDLEGRPSLADAIREINGAAPGARLRLGSLDPSAVTAGFCNELAAISNLCDHFHLSLQSGCDETLRRMGRKYTTGAVREAMSSLRRLFPDCGITADLIAGFPGETDSEFEQTLSFIKAAKFSDMHIFPYSPRPGTRAAAMPGQVTKGMRRERAGIAAVAAGEMARDFAFSQVGKTVEVLFERERGGFWAGHSGNYIEVVAKAGGARNSMSSVRITNVDDGQVLGELVV